MSRPAPTDQANKDQKIPPVTVVDPTPPTPAPAPPIRRPPVRVPPGGRVVGRFIFDRDGLLVGTIY